MYERPARFFFAEIGIIIIAVLAIVIGNIAAGTSMGLGLIVAILFIILSFFLMILMVILSLVFIVKHIKDKDKNNFPLGHLFNFVFSVGVFIGSSFFYIIIFMGIWVILAPFL